MAKRPDWQLCVEWLISCDVMSHEHLEAHSESVESFVFFLRDGVFLCMLLNHLKPGVIESKNFSQRPQMSQFLCTKNISIFLKTCKNDFGLKDSDLFDPADLFEVQNFSKVIRTLSALSKSKIALKVARAFSGQGDYYNIEADLLNDMEYNVVESIYEDKEEEIYTILVNKRKVPPSPALSHREMLIREIVDTERNFVEVLKTIVEKYMPPMRDLLSGNDFKTIFDGVENLYTVHSKLCADLANASSPRGQTTVATVFENNKRGLLAYGDYSSHLEKAQECVHKLLDKPTKVKDFVLKQDEACRARLVDQLYVPVQRVLKYHLLLGQLVKHTQNDDPEYATLQRAWEAMEDVSLYINEVKRDNENLQTIADIQNRLISPFTDHPVELPSSKEGASFNTTRTNYYLTVTLLVRLYSTQRSGTDFKEYGRHLIDGELKVKGPNEKNFSKRYVFLFDRIILICDKQKNDTYKYEGFIILMHVDVQSEDSKARADVTFGLHHKTKTPPESHVFEAKDSDTKSKWLGLINLARDNNKPVGSVTDTHDFHLTSFAEPTECHVCGKFLRGIFYQGYLCKKTNRIVHKECIARASAAAGQVAQGNNHENQNGNRKVLWRATRDYDGNPAPGNNRPALTFMASNMIEVLSDVNSPWIKGRYKGMEGYFPSNYGRLQGPSYEEVAPPTRPRRDVGLPKREAPPRRPSLDNPTASSKKLEDYAWYAGDIGRESAKDILFNAPLGTFLIRHNAEDNTYSLSVRFGTPPNPVRHIKVQVETETGRFSLDKANVFNSLELLVTYYTSHSLGDSFPNVTTKLVSPYQNHPAAAAPRRIMFKCRAKYDFSASQPNQLSFSANDIISVISNSGIYNLWWKGELDEEVGYFPSNYVEQI